MNRPRVLVAGAGYLGSALASAWPEAEIVLARRTAIESPGVRTLACDFNDRASLKSLPEVDLIYYAVSADQGSEDAYEKAYHVGPRNLAEHYLERGQRPAFFYSSSTSVYAESEGGVCDESAPLVERGLSRHMVSGERFLLDSQLPASILRYGGIYGPGRTAFLTRIRDRLEALTPEHVFYMNRIHQRDAVALVPFLFAQRAEGIFNAVDAAPTVRDEVILWVLKALGIPSEDYPRSDSGSARGHRRVLSDKCKKLGYEFLVPSYREGYRDLLVSI